MASLRRQPSQLEDEEDDEDLPDKSDALIIFQGSLIYISFEGEELSTEPFECQVSAPCTGSDIKEKICESCKIVESNFQDVGFEIDAHPIVNRGRCSVKASAAGLKVVYEYFMGCCRKIVNIDSVQRDEKMVQVAVTVTAKAKPAAMPAGTKIYVALSVNDEDFRNDSQHEETFSVKVLRVDTTGCKFQLSSMKVGKTYRRSEATLPALKGPGGAINEAIVCGLVRKAGGCDVTPSGITLHSFKMEGGVLVDQMLECELEHGSSLVEWEQADFEVPNGPRRWTKVWYFVGEEGSSGCGENAKQPWLAYTGASQYWQAICVPSSDVRLFRCEPPWSWGDPERLE